MQTAIQPIQSNERIWLMDSLRGIAILGIYIMNLSGFTLYNGDAPNKGVFFSPADDYVEFISSVLLEGKFYSIFSFLFGWGVVLQLQRASSKGLNAVSFVRRRLAIMFLLGLAHLLFLWTGDIVAFYALVGFVLLWLRNLKDNTLLITAVVLLFSPILFYFLKMHWPPASAPVNFLRDSALRLDQYVNNIQSEEEYFQKVHTMNYWESIKLNVIGVFFRFEALLFQSRASKVLGMFILGYLMGRNNRYKTIITNTKLLWRIAIAGLLIGLPANVAMEIYMDGPDYYQLKIRGLYATIFYAIGVAPLALAYIALFFLAARTSLGQRLFRHIEPVGKIAFTNYLLHSMIGLIVFTGVGFALDRQVGPLYYTLFAFLVFFFQILLSKLWLSRFQYGPVEWLWRSGTYGRRQSMQRISEKNRVTGQ